jgi:beta-carotene hydroxylase
VVFLASDSTLIPVVLYTSKRVSPFPKRKIMVQTIPQSTTPPSVYTGPHQGSFSPTLGLFLAVIVILIMGLVGKLAWGWPHWLPFILNTFALFALSITIHDASHGTAHRTRWVNSFIGHASAILQGFAYPVFVRTHLEHHIHVNDPEKDPDHYVSLGGPLWLMPIRFAWHEIYFFKARLWKKGDLQGWVINRIIQVIMLTLCWQLGEDYWRYCMGLWITPAGVAAFFVGLIFDYFPHRPFINRDRWTNTRVYPNRWLSRLIYGQNYHLAHHLWPNVPWYFYETAYFSRQELFIAKGAPHGLGLDTPRDWGIFAYDLFIGFHRAKDL